MNAFWVPVKTVEEASLIISTLAKYDLFQLRHNVKPDFSNAGGLNVVEDGELVTWYDEESGDSLDDILSNVSSMDKDEFSEWYDGRFDSLYERVKWQLKTVIRA
jgi:hypothetical protein